MPTIRVSRESQTQEEETEPLNEINDSISVTEEICGLCQESSQLAVENRLENYIDLVTKCLPGLNINFENILNKKICQNCINCLIQFSKFIDKITIVHSSLELTNISHLVQKPLQIKKEPDPICEEEENGDYGDECVIVPVSEKKCEILEIVDIKPDLNFDFSGAFNSLKVELCEPREFDYDLEPIMFASHDHSYHQLKNEFENEYSSKAISPKRIPGKVCNKCPRAFFSTKSLLVHKQTSHRVIKINEVVRKSLKKFKNLFKCQNCRKYFKRKESLRIPLLDCRKQVEEKKTEEIAIGSYGLASIQAQFFILKFILVIPPEPKKFICDFCSKSFSGYRNLYQHKKGHTTQTISCTLCPSKFKRKNGLSQHIKSVHLNIKPHTCSICQKKYFFKTDMVRCKHSKGLKNRK